MLVLVFFVFFPKFITCIAAKFLLSAAFYYEQHIPFPNFGEICLGLVSSEGITTLNETHKKSAYDKKSIRIIRENIVSAIKDIPPNVNY